MADQKRVMIVHPDGREYSILPADFTNSRVSDDKQSYADQGFRIASYADQTPYEGPSTKREIEQAAQARVVAREVHASAKPDGKGQG